MILDSRRVYKVLAIGIRSSKPYNCLGVRVYEALAIGTRSSIPRRVYKVLVIGTRFHEVLAIGTLLEGGRYSNGTMSFQ
jgi:hypothetical protein